VIGILNKKDITNTWYQLRVCTWLCETYFNYISDSVQIKQNERKTNN